MLKSFLIRSYNISLSKILKSCLSTTSNLKTHLNTTSDEIFEASDRATYQTLKKFMVVRNDFLSETDEKNLLDEVDPYMQRLRYEFDHWDNAIHGYRETERDKWTSSNRDILNKVKEFAFEMFENKTNLLNHIHILDLHEDGFIKLHVDSTRFCGNTIVGLSLLSDSVMRLRNETNKDQYAKVLLKRRSLYIMREDARYKFGHEILKNDESVFKGVAVIKKRRVSVIMRNESNDLV